MQKKVDSMEEACEQTKGSLMYSEMEYMVFHDNARCKNHVDCKNMRLSLSKGSLIGLDISNREIKSEVSNNE